MSTLRAATARLALADPSLRDDLLWLLAAEGESTVSKGTFHVRFGKPQVRITLRRKSPDRQMPTLVNTANEVVATMGAFMSQLTANLGGLGVTVGEKTGGTTQETKLICGRFGVLVQCDGELAYNLMISSRDESLAKAARAAARSVGGTAK
jgi:hypothetical protein